MAYPGGQFQQASDSSFGYGEAPYNAPAQHTLSRALYQDGTTPYGSYDRSHPDSAPHQHEGMPGVRSFGPSREKPQRSGQQASWGRDVQQLDFNGRINARDEQCWPVNRHGVDDNRRNVQYGTAKSPPGSAHRRNQDYSRGDPSPRIDQKEEPFPPRDGYDIWEPSLGDYGSPGAPPPRNAHHGFQNPYVRRPGPMTYAASAEQRPPEGMDQQQAPWLPPDQRTANTGNTSHHGEGPPKVPRKSRAPTPAREKPRKPAKERILTSPTSPETISWDNPFPTFPSSKKIINHTPDENLNRSMGGMSLDGKAQAGVPEESRPSTRDRQLRHNSPRNVGLPRAQEGATTYMKGAHRPLDQLMANGMQGVSCNPQSMQRSNDRSHPTSQLRPQTDYGRRSEDTARDPPLRRPAVSPPDDQRSRTMPATVTNTFASPNSQRIYGQQPIMHDPRPDLSGRQDRAYLENPLHQQHTRPPMQPHSRSVDVLPDHGRVNREPQTLHPQSYHSQQASIGEVFDSYYHSPHHSNSSFAQEYADLPRTPRDEDLPNFDSPAGQRDGHGRGMTIHDHLDSQQRPHALPPIPANAHSGVSSGPQSLSSRSKSSPNLQQQSIQGLPQYSDGFDFELPGSVPAMYSASPPPGRDTGQEAVQPRHGDRQQTYAIDWPQVSTRYRQPNSRPNVGEPYGGSAPSRSPDGQHRQPPPQAPPSHEHQRRNPRDGPSTTNSTGPGSPPVGQLPNPDALPAHPAPVRVGLMANAVPNQPPRPRPVRQYTGGSAPRTESPSSPRPQISRVPREESKPAGVSLEGLERLRQTIRSSPFDSKTQLLLARRLVEAVSALADEGGRADPKTTARNRERLNSEAHKVVKKLAQNNYTDAIFYLGDCYSRGFLGLQTDPKEAFSHYQSAAKAGHAQAAYRVAVCCEMGLDEGGGTKRDAVKAMQWYQRAATLGDTPAMYKLGVIQLKGLLGQPKNASAALSWLQRAAAQADKENPHALHELALLHEAPNSIDGIRQDEAHAKQLLIEAANLGYKFSQFRLGCTFEYGLLGCPVDPRQSIAWYSKAAVQDEHQSELALSGWYLTGSEGVLQQSDTEAYLWARKAAQAGLAKAEYAMGYFTEVGIGTPANIEDAKRWYWRSASQNFPKARERLEDLRRGGAKMQKTRVSRSKMNKQSEGECIVM